MKWLSEKLLVQELMSKMKQPWREPVHVVISQLDSTAQQINNP